MELVRFDNMEPTQLAELKNAKLARLMTSMLKQHNELHCYTKGEVVYFSIDGTAELLNATHERKVRQEFNTFADVNNIPKHLPAFKPKKGKGFPKLAFAPVDDIVLFLRARKSDAAQALVAKIDAFLADQTTAQHEEELEEVGETAFEAQKASFEAQAAKKRAEDRARQAEEERDAQFEFDQATIKELKGENAALKEKRLEELVNLSDKDKRALMSGKRSMKQEAEAAIDHEFLMDEITQDCASIEKEFGMPKGPIYAYVRSTIDTHLLSHTKNAIDTVMGDNTKAVQKYAGISGRKQKMCGISLQEAYKVNKRLSNARHTFETMKRYGVLTYDKAELPNGEIVDGVVKAELKMFDETIKSVGKEKRDRDLLGKHNTSVDIEWLDKETKDQEAKHCLALRQHHLRIKKPDGKYMTHAYGVPHSGQFGQDQLITDARRSVDYKFLCCFVDAVQKGEVHFPLVNADPALRDVEDENEQKIKEMAWECGVEKDKKGSHSPAHRWYRCLTLIARLNKEAEESEEYRQMWELPGAREYLQSNDKELGAMIHHGMFPTEFKSHKEQELVQQYNNAQKLQELQQPQDSHDARKQRRKQLQQSRPLVSVCMRQVFINEFLRKRGRILNEVIELTCEVDGASVDCIIEHLPMDRLFDRIKGSLIHYKDLDDVMEKGDDDLFDKVACGHSRETVLMKPVHEFQCKSHYEGGDADTNGVLCIVLAVIINFFDLLDRLDHLHHSDPRMCMWSDEIEKLGANDFAALASAISCPDSVAARVVVAWKDEIKQLASPEYEGAHGVVVPVFNSSICTSAGRSDTNKFQLHHKDVLNKVIESCKVGEKNKQYWSKSKHPVHHRPSRHRKGGKGRMGNSKPNYARNFLAFLYND